MAKKLISYDDQKPGLGLPDVVEEGLGEVFAARRAQVHDTFEDTPDGSLPTHTDSGHEWAYMSARGLEVRDGHLRSTPGDFGTMPHAEISMGAPVTRMGATFRFNSEGGTRTTSGLIALNSWGDGGIAANGGGRRTRAHLDMTPTSCGLGVRAVEGAGGTIEIVGGRYYFPTPLSPDTWYTLEWHISGDTAAIIMPDGHVHVVSDPRIETVPADFADFQLSQVKTATDLIPEVREVWADAAPDVPSENSRMAFKALTTTSNGDSVLPNSQYIQVMDSSGTPRRVFGMSTADTLILRNESVPTPRAEIHLRSDGRVLLGGVAGGASVTQDGNLYATRIDLSTSNHTITFGSGSPEGVKSDSRGSLYIQYNGGRGQTLWARESQGAGNTGWRPMGHPSGLTSQRPSSPVVGLSYFDQTLGKPIWWNGTTWVDANGVDADTPPAGE